tara:strand:- start:16505 stop:16948 length:444 start_codon:yes stop_codon:yes gene_type:complete
MVIPQKIITIGVLFGIISTILKSKILSSGQSSSLLINNLSASILAFLVLLSIKIISEYLTRRKCLGLGDVKLSALGGIWLGVKGIFLALTLSFLCAGLFSFYRFSRGSLKNFEAFPFAPFLSAFIFGVWLLGEEWWIENSMRLLGLK